MAVIENITNVAEMVRIFEAMSNEELIATDLVQRGAIDALTKLQIFGVSADTVAAMLLSAKVGHERLRTISTARGVRLVAED